MMNNYYNRNRLSQLWGQGYYPQQQGMYPQQQMGMGSGLLGGFARQDKNATVAEKSIPDFRK